MKINIRTPKKKKFRVRLLFAYRRQSNVIRRLCSIRFDYTVFDMSSFDFDQFDTPTDNEPSGSGILSNAERQDPHFYRPSIPICNHDNNKLRCAKYAAHFQDTNELQSDL